MKTSSMALLLILVIPAFSFLGACSSETSVDAPGGKIIVKEKGWVSIQPSMHTEAIELESEAITPEQSEILIQKVEEFIKDII